jgi:hypothetical protein
VSTFLGARRLTAPAPRVTPSSTTRWFMSVEWVVEVGATSTARVTRAASGVSTRKVSSKVTLDGAAPITGRGPLNSYGGE